MVLKTFALLLGCTVANTSDYQIVVTVNPTKIFLSFKKAFGFSIVYCMEGFLGLPTTVLGHPLTQTQTPPHPYPNTNLGHPRTPDANPGHV